MDAIIGVLTEVGKCLYLPLKTRLGYLVHYKKKVDNLTQRLADFEPEREDLETTITAAKMRGEVIKRVPGARLEKATELKTRAGAMATEVEEDKRCFGGCCPDPVRRYRLGKEATKKVVEAEELYKKIEEFRGEPVSWPPLLPTAESMRIRDFMNFRSTTEAMREIMDALEQEKMHLIGIYGMGGVGKTTLMEEVGRLVREDNKFDAVVKVVVSQNPDVGQVRRDIAKKLGLLGNGEPTAASLAESLKKIKKVLILLDDVWARLELRNVGIPYGNDHSGCKILLTTRKAQVCEAMRTDTKIMVNVLSDDDSWILFKSNAGDVIDSADLKPVAQKVAKECGGLPLAIVAVGRALRGRHMSHVWERALMQLQRSVYIGLEGVEDELLKCLELSYNYMEDVETKLLFLFCCLFREDYDISEDELARYAMGDGFLRGVYTLEEARARVGLLVEDLIASCLLLRTDKEGYVKMHDVVRDVAVHIASRGEDRFFVKARLGMRDWPESENFITCKRISLMNNDISALPDQPRCPELLTLLLNLNPSLSDIPSNFFIEMKALTVLDISDTNISSLPPALAGLTNLGTLRLDRCPKLCDISSVGQLRKLQILGLQKCPMKSLPEEIGSLVHLKLLDLSFCTSLKVPCNVMGKLCRMEELYMRSCITNEDLLVEIASLRRLVRLQLYVRDVKFFSYDIVPVDAWVNLSHFIIYTEFDLFASADVYQRNFYLKGVTHIADWAKALLRTAEDLVLEVSKWDSTNLADLDEDNGFSSLKKLSLTRCHHIKCLLDTTQKQIQASPSIFPNIEVLHLWNLENLNGICWGRLPTESFRKLRKLDIMCCKKLVDIMPGDFLLRVHDSLQELAVKECDEAREVFNFEGLNEECDMLPNLRKLTLHRLPNVTSIWSRSVPPGSLQKLQAIELIGCDRLASIFSLQLASSCSDSLCWGTFANLKELKVQRCRGLRYLFLPSLANELPNLERLELKNNDAMVDVIGAEDGVMLDKGAFPLLKDLLIINMSTLKSFYNGEPASISLNWPALKYIQLGQCPNLKRLPIGLATAPKLEKVHVAANDDIAWFQGLEWEDASIPSRFEISAI